MENIDEVQIDAARFVRRAQEIWRPTGKGDKVILWRLLTLLLFMRGTLSEHWDNLRWRDPSRGIRFGDESVIHLLDSMRKLRAEMGLHSPEHLDERNVPAEVLNALQIYVDQSFEQENFHGRLDYLIELIATSGQTTESELRSERFVAKLVGTWGNYDYGRMLELNPAPLGLVHEFSGASYCTFAKLDENCEFEVLMRQRAHGLGSDVRDGIYSSDAKNFELVVSSRVVQVKQSLSRVTLGAPVGLAAATWFSLSARGSQRAAILIGLREAQGVDFANTRRDLLMSGLVRGVIELPRRVSGTRRSFLLLLEYTGSQQNDEVVMLDGRALDGLEDEPLDSLASFSALPLIRNWDAHELLYNDRNTLSERLIDRAVIMFARDVGQVAGSYARRSPEEMLSVPRYSLVPEHYIPARDDSKVTSALDPAPIQQRLDLTQRGCTYIIGDNGAGKSLLLRDLVDHCLGDGKAVRAIATSHSDRFPLTNKQGGYRYLGNRSKGDSTSLTKLGKYAAEQILGIYRDSERLTAWRRIASLLRFEGKEFVLPASHDPQLADAIRSMDEVGSGETLTGWRLGVQRRERGAITPFDHLSAGEQQVLLLAAKLVGEAATNVVFLIDEPETSLHVAWQRALPTIFAEVCEQFGAAFVVATHSPVLMSAATNSCDARFVARGGILKEIHRSRSSSVEGLLFDGFGTYTENNREVHERCAELVSASIDAANLGDLDVVRNAIVEIQRMENLVERSNPILGKQRTDPHLDLLRSAATVLQKLQVEVGQQEGRVDASSH